jgi:DNA-binding transcriptional MerR regulator
MSDGVRIGELAALCGVSTRALRYYEQQGLIRPERAVNGYRVYGPEQVEAVGHIRLLLEAGLSTDAVRDLLPCWADSLSRGACPELVATLDGHLAAADRRLACQTQTRDMLAALRERVASRMAAA